MTAILHHILYKFVAILISVPMLLGINIVSALAPSSAPNAQYEAGNVQKGIWYTMPIIYGDHMCLQGGMTKINDVKNFYTEHLSMINSLSK